MKYYVYGITPEKEYAVLKVENPLSIGLTFMSYAELVSGGGTVELIGVGGYLVGSVQAVGTHLVSNYMLSSLILLEDKLPLVPKLIVSSVSVSMDKDNQCAYVCFDLEVSCETYSYIQKVLDQAPVGISSEDITNDMFDALWDTCEVQSIEETVDLSDWFDEFGDCIYNI